MFLFQQKKHQNLGEIRPEAPTAWALENQEPLHRTHRNPVALPSPVREEETGHIVETASSTSESTRGGRWTSSPISSRKAIGRGRIDAVGQTLRALFLADPLLKSKDQGAAHVSATTPGMRGGEAHIGCLNTDSI